VKLLSDSLALCDRAYATVTAANVAEMITTGQNQAARVGGGDANPATDESQLGLVAGGDERRAAGEGPLPADEISGAIEEQYIAGAGGGGALDAGGHRSEEGGGHGDADGDVGGASERTNQCHQRRFVQIVGIVEVWCQQHAQGLRAVPQVRQVGRTRNASLCQPVRESFVPL
jgi:hypothetical protein